MTSELKPCPFCGGEAKVRRSEFGYKAFCDKPFCCWMGTFRTEQEAITVWNQRAERTCKLRKAAWNNGTCTWGVVCSSCGKGFEHESGKTWNYCPSCGARVVE